MKYNNVRILCIIVLCFLSKIPIVYAQESFTVKGKVNAMQTNESLPGATVIEKGTQNGVATDENGNFEIKVSNPNAIIIATFVGFKNKEIEINNQSYIEIKLISEDEQLDEVVVVGYASKKKRDVISSIATIKTDEISNIPVSSFDGALQGKASGVQVSTNTGVPGAPVNVIIRGNSSITQGSGPLWVIDGIPVNSSSMDKNEGSTSQGVMSLINPSDIESINILKDAAATSIYGSRGSHGVIIITTKSGKFGKEKGEGYTSFDFDYSTGISNLEKNPHKMYVDGKTWFEIADKSIQSFSQDTSLSLFDPSLVTVYNRAFDTISRESALKNNTDWFDHVLRKNGSYHDLNISGSSGNNKSAVYFSGNYRKDESLSKNNNLERLSGRVNIDLQPIKNLKTGVKLNATYTKNDRIKSDKNAGAFGSGGGRSGGFGAANRGALPWLPIYSNTDPTGYWSPATNLNLVANLDDKYVRDDVETFRSLGGGYIEYNLPFLKELTIRSEISYDFIQSNSIIWINKYLMQDTMTYGVDAAKTHSDLLFNTIATYDKTIKSHNFNVVIGTESQRKNDVNRETSGKGLIGDRQILGTPSFEDWVKVSPSEYYIKSYFTRLSYKFKDRYLFGINFRRDGSSKFTEDNRFENFSGIAIGWIVTEEKFIPISKQTLNFFKLRGSYGQTGSDNIPTEQSLTTVTTNTNWRYGYMDDITLGSHVDHIGNGTLKWEVTNNYDVGFDYGLLKNRLSGSFAYYQRFINDLLIQVDLPPSTGMSNNKMYANAASMKDYGLEFNITSVNIDKQSIKFRWTTDFNIATNDNLILQLNDYYDNGIGMLQNEGNTNDVYVTRKNGKLKSYYMADYAGIDYDHGVEMIWEIDKKTLEETGKTVKTGRKIPATLTNCKENRYIHEDKTPFPTYYGGINNSVEFHNLYLNIFFTYTGGNYIYDENMKTTSYIHNGTNVIRNEILNNTWTQENKDAEYMQLTWVSKNPWDMNLETGEWVYSTTNPGNYTPEGRNLSKYLFKGDFVRLKTIQLGYNLPEKMLKKYAIKSVKIYFTSTNLWTYAFEYPGYDPEGLNWISAYNLPNLRTFTFGTSLKF